jgi:hypothetical protein
MADADDTCRSCGAPILWRQSSTNGRPMPLDPEPVDGGHFALTPTEAIYLHFPQGPQYQAHFVSCPAGPEWRGRKRERAG